jgi:hypothetical protein
MLHHCLDGPTARLLTNFSTGTSDVPSAFVTREIYSFAIIESDLSITKKG